MPQIAYYFAAATQLGAPYRNVSFSVPTGNFGDIFAGYAAKRMGLGVDRLVIASNSNDILPRTLETGVYETKTVMATTSPSMDIQVSSNFERYLFEAQDRDAATVRRQMQSLVQSGRFQISGEGAASLDDDFAADRAGEADVASCIRRTRDDTGYLLDPHTACGIVALDRKLGDRIAPEVVLATAHPAKFAEAMTEIIGAPVPLPARLSHLLNERERSTSLVNEQAAVQDFIRARTRATPA